MVLSTLEQESKDLLSARGVLWEDMRPVLEAIGARNEMPGTCNHPEFIAAVSAVAALYPSSLLTALSQDSGSRGEREGEGRGMRGHVPARRTRSACDTRA